MQIEAKQWSKLTEYEKKERLYYKLKRMIGCSSKEMRSQGNKLMGEAIEELNA